MRNPLILIGGVLVAVLVVLALVGLGRDSADRKLDSSVMGTDGLANWLRANKVDITRATPRFAPLQDDVSVAILPLYDADLDRSRRAPDSDEERMTNTAPREAVRWLLEDMQDKLPTLVLMPKWREGFAITGIAHEETQIAPRDVERLAGQVALRGSALVPVRNGMTEARITGASALAGRRIALFRAQLFDRDRLDAGCTELAGIAEGALLVTCRSGDDVPGGLFLSDPDLLNNHGLRLADNAGFALDLVAYLRAGDDRPVLLATHPVWLREYEDEPEPHERTAEDLSRFFQWPLSALWLMAVAVLGLAVWRGARRFGPPRGADPDPAASSRRAAIAAKARLLRLSGADARMAGEHVRSHLADLAVRTLGPGNGNDSGIARWYARLARHDPDLERAIRDSVARIAPDTNPADLPRLIETFHALTRKAQDAA